METCKIQTKFVENSDESVTISFISNGIICDIKYSNPKSWELWEYSELYKTMQQNDWFKTDFTNAKGKSMICTDNGITTFVADNPGNELAHDQDATIKVSIPNKDALPLIEKLMHSAYKEM